jgi:plastocyanin
MIHPRGPRWTPGVAAGLGSLLLVAAACTAGPAATPSSTASAAGSTASSGAASASASASASEAAGPKIVISTTTNFGGLDQITVKAGEPLTISNVTSVPHTFTQGKNGQPAKDPVVNETIQPGAAVPVTFPTAGDFHVTCTIHQVMNIDVHVE